MTTTEIATIDAEVLPEPLSEGKAKVLDKRIRQAGIRVADQTASLLDLLEEALVGKIHVALGFPSFTAYVKEAVRITPTDVDERKALVSMMSGKGLSQRAMAAVAGVDQATISRDLAGDANASTNGQTIGTDGKTYKRKEKEQEPLDVEFEEEPEEEERKPADVVEDFGSEIDTLLIDVQAFKDVLDDELFDKARKRIAQRFVKRLNGAIKDLQDIFDTLTEE
jgi:transcriptional regulator with XRE-family HTH domain